MSDTAKESMLVLIPEQNPLSKSKVRQYEKLRSNISEQDFLIDLASRSSKKIHRALSNLTGYNIPEIFFKLNQIELKEKDVVLDIKNKCFGVYSQISAPFDGIVLIFFPLSSISPLIDLVQKNYGQKELSPEMRLSAFKEIGNIITSTYVTELANLLGKKIQASYF